MKENPNKEDCRLALIVENKEDEWLGSTLPTESTTVIPLCLNKDLNRVEGYFWTYQCHDISIHIPARVLTQLLHDFNPFPNKQETLYHDTQMNILYLARFPFQKAWKDIGLSACTVLPHALPLIIVNSLIHNRDY